MPVEVLRGGNATIAEQHILYEQQDSTQFVFVDRIVGEQIQNRAQFLVGVHRLDFCRVSSRGIALKWSSLIPPGIEIHDPVARGCGFGV